jgi:hypothetical protein
MIKTYLIKYKAEKFQALNSLGTTFVLVVEKHWLWGLIVTQKSIKIQVSNLSTYATTKKWDSFIENKLPIK